MVLLIYNWAGRRQYARPLFIAQWGKYSSVSNNNDWSARGINTEGRVNNASSRALNFEVTLPFIRKQRSKGLRKIISTYGIYATDSIWKGKKLLQSKWPYHSKSSASQRQEEMLIALSYSFPLKQQSPDLRRSYVRCCPNRQRPSARCEKNCQLESNTSSFKSNQDS